jgi:extracellular elastinolytic metalloproteinase
MIAKHGYVGSLFPPPPLEDGTVPIGDFYRSPETLAEEAAGHLVPKHGNSLMVQLVLNAMKLQQCRPGFFEARDAIIQADQVLTGGENYCDLWLGFAEKGLGVDASVQGRTPWGGGIRKDVRTSFYMTPDLTSDVLRLQGYKVPAVCRDEEVPEPSPEPSPDDPSEDDPEDDLPWASVYI